MNSEKIQGFSIIGIAVRTTNEDGQSGKDIPALWNKFMTENAMDKIPGKIDQSIYCMYTDYEKDHTKPYTTILGCRVENLSIIPEGMAGKEIASAFYSKFIAKGNLQEGVVFNEWLKIWESDLQRKFTADFEVYGEKARDPENAEVEIFIAV